MGSRERPKTECPGCHVIGKVDRGRSFSGRRAYRCKLCGAVWTMGRQGRRPRYSIQRDGYQFADTGASRQVHVCLRGLPPGLVPRKE